MTLAEHVVRLKRRGYMCRILVEKPEAKGRLGRLKVRLKRNMELILEI
jgi:hypothetical protein